ncbi:hypothetical protein PV772_11295 [Pseudarthrobacter sp. CC12]|uniref:hypothetical protein n=1 Tax=Pseudarthrobacter sp. CC12 TaxID=3029193 RepID=UPI003263B788
MNQDNLQDWAALNIGDRVTVIERTGQRWPGTVDMKMDDSTVVWVLGNVGGRRAFDCREEIRLETTQQIPWTPHH